MRRPTVGEVLLPGSRAPWLQAARGRGAAPDNIPQGGPLEEFFWSMPLRLLLRPVCAVSSPLTARAQWEGGAGTSVSYAPRVCLG